MKSPPRVVMAGGSHPGKVRAQNEDRVATRPQLGLAVLADGMGGHQAGEVASAMATETIVDHVAATLSPGRGRQPARKMQGKGKLQLIAEAIQKANTAVYQAARNRAEYRGMGSTVVVALVNGGRLYFAHAGDSRLYRLRRGVLEQLTQDHSLVQDLISRGLFTPAEARRSMAKNVVTRALGVDPAIEADLADTVVRSGDVYLLCSDGLTDVVSDDEIARILQAAGDRSEAAVRRLLDRANELGGPDNISAIVLRFK